MEKLREVVENYDDPWWRRQRLLSRGVSPLTKLLYEPGDLDIIAEKWDNLLLFDACRADMFEETIDTSSFDSYSRVRSNAENSPEWLRKNLDGEELHDTIYVTANPQVQEVQPSGLFKIIDVFENIDEYETDYDIDWDELGTVPAPLMNQVVTDVHQQQPNKRLIVHYFQPHNPVIGDKDGTVNIDRDLAPRDSLVTGEVSRKEVWNGYRRNLQYVFHHAEDLLDHLNGTSVITADHGELLGERLWPIPIRGYAHPAGVYHPNLLTVPYAVIQNGKREVVAWQHKRH